MPQPGWPRLLSHGAVAALCMGLFLFWANGQWNWIEMGEHAWYRLATLGLVLLVSAGIYFGVLTVLGFRFKNLLTPQT